MKATPRALLGLLALVAAAVAGTQWLNARTQARLGSEMAAAAKPGDIQMLSSETCPFCNEARAWLNAHGVAHRECFIERDAVCRKAFDAVGARGTPTVLVRGVAQTGFDAQRVLSALRQQQG